MCSSSFCTLLVDENFYEWLVNESVAGPQSQDDFHVNAVGDNSNLWVDVCQAFKNDSYKIPAIPV